MLGLAEGRLLGWVLKDGDCEGFDEGIVDIEGVSEGCRPIDERKSR